MEHQPQQAEDVAISALQTATLAQLKEAIRRKEKEEKRVKLRAGYFYK